MIIYDDLEQGSEQWLALRLGKPTTSNFSKIITPKGTKSGQFNKYNTQLVAELLTGEGEPFYQSEAMARGNYIEDEAVQFYADMKRVSPRKVGFVLSDGKRVGCSPDRLIGEEGLLEVKCPLQTKHTENLLRDNVDSQYIPQIQGQLLITERKWCDWLSYHPDLPPAIIRVERDDEYCKKLMEYLVQFIAEMDDKINKLKAKGVEFYGATV